MIFGFAIADLFAPLFEGTEFETHIDGLAEFYGIKEASKTSYNVEYRVDLYKISWQTFQNYPFFGNVEAPNGGHNYFLDRLAYYGIFGTMPLILFIYYNLKRAYYYIPVETRRIFLICIIGFVLLGFLKNMAGIDYWTYMFLYIPCILKLTEGPSFKNH